MRNLILSFATLLSTASLFANNSIVTNLASEIKPNPKKTSGKKASNNSNSKTLYCQVVEVKDGNNNATIMAIFSDLPADKSTVSDADNIYLNHLFFTEVKVIEDVKKVSNYKTLVENLKRQYTGIKIWGQ